MDGFINELKKTLLSPREYFPSMAKEGGLGPPLIKVMLYGLIAGAISCVWSVLKIFAFSGSVAGSTAAGGFMALAMIVLTPIFAIVFLFIGALFCLLFSAIAGGNTQFEANLRVCAAVSAIMVVSAVANVFSLLNIYLGSLVNFAVTVYGFILLYHGLTLSLKGKETPSKVICGILIGIWFLFTVSSMAFLGAANKFKDEVIDQSLKNNPGLSREDLEQDPDKFAQEAEKQMQELLKKFQEAQQKQGQTAE